MSRKARHNQRVRSRILQAAGKVFRAHGYERSKIDDIMEDAGLTRGAFYAHFPAKSALLSAVIGERDIFLLQLQQRSDAAPDALRLGLCDLIARFLAPAHFQRVRSSWNLPILARDAALGDPAARLAFERTSRAIFAEMSRGFPDPPKPMIFQAVLCQMTGALEIAGACASDKLRADLLEAARDAACAALEAAFGQENG
ncbi:MAG: TetR/AcrR family transcriptional regulator [Pseudomonadota bacterium]